MTKVEFLLARIAEDEAQLDRAAEIEAEWVRRDGMPGTTAADVRAYWLQLGPGQTQWPRLLAEAKAKRAIIDLFLSLLERYDTSLLAAGQATALDWVLDRMVEVYAGSEGYAPDKWDVQSKRMGLTDGQH